MTVFYAYYKGKLVKTKYDHATIAAVAYLTRAGHSKAAIQEATGVFYSSLQYVAELVPVQPSLLVSIDEEWGMQL